LLPRSAWRTIELDLPTRKYRTPRVFEQKVSLAGATFSQLFIQDLGHDQPTILLTNQHRLSAKKLITRYAQRMLIENALSDAVRFFHLDALSSAVGLKIDFDMVLLVIASGLYRILAKTMRGYSDAQARPGPFPYRGHISPRAARPRWPLGRAGHDGRYCSNPATRSIRSKLIWRRPIG